MKTYDDGKDLFSQPPKAMPDSPLVPRTVGQITRGPQTSFAAGDKIIPKLRKLQMDVLRMLATVGSAGLTDLELEEAFGDHGSTYRTRRAELVTAGLVCDTGKKRVQNGRARMVWAVTAAGTAILTP